MIKTNEQATVIYDSGAINLVTIGTNYSNNRVTIIPQVTDAAYRQYSLVTIYVEIADAPAIILVRHGGQRDIHIETVANHVGSQIFLHKFLRFGVGKHCFSFPLMGGVRFLVNALRVSGESNATIKRAVLVAR